MHAMGLEFFICWTVCIIYTSKHEYHRGMWPLMASWLAICTFKLPLTKHTVAFHVSIVRASIQSWWPNGSMWVLQGLVNGPPFLFGLAEFMFCWLLRFYSSSLHLVIIGWTGPKCRSNVHEVIDFSESWRRCSHWGFTETGFWELHSQKFVSSFPASDLSVPKQE
jgi:hypothetical protein